jgi:hypothetical protein
VSSVISSSLTFILNTRLCIESAPGRAGVQWFSVDDEQDQSCGERLSIEQLLCFCHLGGSVRPARVTIRRPNY